MISMSDLYQKLFLRDEKDLLETIENLVSKSEVPACFLALTYAAYGQIDKSIQILETCTNEADTRYCDETKVLIAYSKKQEEKTIEIASTLLDKYPDADITRYALAITLYRKRKPHEALEHYKVLHKKHPNRNSIKLGIAGILIYQKEHNKAREYVLRCQPTLEQKLYLLLIPIDQKALYRLMTIMFGVFLGVLTNARIWVLGIITLLILMGIVWSLKKSKFSRAFIAARLINVELLVILSWIIAKVFTFTP